MYIYISYIYKCTLIHTVYYMDIRLWCSSQGLQCMHVKVVYVSRNSRCSDEVLCQIKSLLIKIDLFAKNVCRALYFFQPWVPGETNGGTWDDLPFHWMPWPWMHRWSCIRGHFVLGDLASKDLALFPNGFWSVTLKRRRYLGRMDQRPWATHRRVLAFFLMHL